MGRKEQERQKLKVVRLSALAMIHTHYDMVIDMEGAVDIYARLHTRKVELKTLFY